MGVHNPSDNSNATCYGTLESDGGTYEVWMKWRINAPSIISGPSARCDTSVAPSTRPGTSKHTEKQASLSVAITTWHLLSRVSRVVALRTLQSVLRHRQPYRSRRHPGRVPRFPSVPILACQSFEILTDQCQIIGYSLETLNSIDPGI
jgi:hypothetical protein